MVESKITRDFTAQCSLFTYTKIQTIMLIYKHGLLMIDNVVHKGIQAHIIHMQPEYNHTKQNISKNTYIIEKNIIILKNVLFFF